MEKGYSVSKSAQSAELVEYVVTSRPESPSIGRMISDSTVVAVKLILSLLSISTITAIFYYYSHAMTTEYWYYAAGLWTLTCIVLLRRPYKVEKLLVLQDFGIQVYSSGMWYRLGGRTRFIPKSKILDILIQEAFVGFEIRFIMVIVVLGEPKLEVTFQDILPRRDDIIEIWRDARQCYYRK